MGPSLSCMPVPPAPPVCRITMAPRPAIWLGANGPLLSPFLSVFNTKSSRLMATSLPKRGATSTATTIQCPPRSEPSNSFTASGFVYAVAVITTDSFSPRASGGLLLSLLRAAPRDTTQTSTSAIPATRATIIRASASIIPGSLILHHSCGADLQVCAGPPGPAGERSSPNHTEQFRDIALVRRDAHRAALRCRHARHWLVFIAIGRRYPRFLDAYAGEFQWLAVSGHGRAGAVAVRLANWSDSHPGWSGGRCLSNQWNPREAQARFRGSRPARLDCLQWRSGAGQCEPNRRRSRIDCSQILRPLCHRGRERAPVGRWHLRRLGPYALDHQEPRQDVAGGFRGAA